MRKNDTSNDASTETTEPTGFYGRWARRKKQAREGASEGASERAFTAEEVAASESTTALTSTGNEVVSEAQNSELEARAAPVLTDADMPTLESLGAEGDYSGFMSEGVSEKLRNKALRQLFRGAQFNITDGLDDYDEDFTNFELLGDIVTQDMKYEREYEAQRIREREEEAAALEQERENAKALEDQGETPLQVENESGLKSDAVTDDPGEALAAEQENLVLVADEIIDETVMTSAGALTKASPIASDSATNSILDQNNGDQNQANLAVSPKAINSETQDNTQGGSKE